MNADDSHAPEPDGMEIPPHFFWQIRALAFVSGKTPQQALTAALAAAFPHPNDEPGNILEMAHGMLMPGDEHPTVAERFRQVRDAEKIPLRDDEIDNTLEKLSGIVCPDTAALLAQAGQIIATGEVVDHAEPEAKPFRLPGDEWKDHRPPPPPRRALWPPLARARSHAPARRSEPASFTGKCGFKRIVAG